MNTRGWPGSAPSPNRSPVRGGAAFRPRGVALWNQPDSILRRVDAWSRACSIVTGYPSELLRFAQSANPHAGILFESYSRFQNGCRAGLGCRAAWSSACGRSQDTEVQRSDQGVRRRFAPGGGAAFAQTSTRMSRRAPPTDPPPDRQGLPGRPKTGDDRSSGMVPDTAPSRPGLPDRRERLAIRHGPGKPPR